MFIIGLFAAKRYAAQECDATKAKSAGNAGSKNKPINLNAHQFFITPIQPYL
jgi:hypothetical protein